MKIYVKIKALAKKKPVIDRAILELAVEPADSCQLVEAIVRESVRAFNSKKADEPIFPYLSGDELASRVQAGKVGFGDKKNEELQDEEKAVQNALQCFADGIFRMYINDTEAAYGEAISLKESDELTFIRLTMLAGRLW